MDLSKLPKLSQSPPPPANDPDPTPGQMPQRAIPVSPYDDPPNTIPAEVWISAVLAVIFLFWGWSFAQYAGCVITGKTYHTNINWIEGPKAGTEVSYPELQGYQIWNDSGMLIFGLALAAEALVLVAAAKAPKFQRPLAGLGFFLAFLSTAYNIVVAAIFFNAGTLPIYSLLAVAFGGYMATYLWRLFKSPVMSPPALPPGAATPR